MSNHNTPPLQTEMENAGIPAETPVGQTSEGGYTAPYHTGNENAESSENRLGLQSDSPETPQVAVPLTQLYN